MGSLATAKRASLTNHAKLFQRSDLPFNGTVPDVVKNRQPTNGAKRIREKKKENRANLGKQPRRREGKKEKSMPGARIASAPRPSLCKSEQHRHARERLRAPSRSCFLFFSNVPASREDITKKERKGREEIRERKKQRRRRGRSTNGGNTTTK